MLAGKKIVLLFCYYDSMAKLVSLQLKAGSFYLLTNNHPVNQLTKQNLDTPLPKPVYQTTKFLITSPEILFHGRDQINTSPLFISVQFKVDKHEWLVDQIWPTRHL